MIQTDYKYRFLARIVIEASSPLKIGSGDKNIKTDSAVLRDANGLPFIPGTTLAGLIRESIITLAEKDLLMGSKKEGSQVILTEAKMLDAQGNVLDGIVDKETLSKGFLPLYKDLPIRQHVKIGHKGTAVKHNKYDEEIVFKGTRFCFEMEMISKTDDEKPFKRLLGSISSETFRIGSGSRSGFGAISVKPELCKCSTRNEW